MIPVDEKAFDPHNLHTDDLVKYTVVKLLQLMKTELLIVAHIGNDTVVNLVQSEKAAAPILVHTGNDTVVKLLQLMKA